MTLFGAASAQHYTAGWSPGQPADQPSAGEWSPDQSTHSQPAQQAGLFDFSKILTSGPVNSLLLKAGVNITKNLEDAAEKEDKRWDKRIPLITDDNYEALIVNETLTEEEEKNRVWFLIMYVLQSSYFCRITDLAPSTTAKSQTGAFSELVDASFDEAYDLAVNENILPNVRWGRIDYLEVTALTTKWVVWQYVTLANPTLRNANHL